MAGRAPKARRPRAALRSRRFAIVAARFNERITQRLVDGARAAFSGAGLGADRLEVHWVPGSFELPQAAAFLAATRRYAGIVCVGVVIRGQTPHFEHVAREAAAGIREVALSTGVPATFGVVTAFSEEQAWERAGGAAGYRGGEAAEAALAMAEWFDEMRRNGAGRSPVRRGGSARAGARAPLSGHPRSPRARGRR
jgi:6,7-dimethyl-8-ribityllumazine synthase